MAKLEWSERLSVGVPELDEDHQTLIQIINSLREHQAAEASPKAIDRCLNALVRYAELHFAREEFRADPEGSSELVGDRLLEFLENWLIKHILVVDMDYKPLVEGKRAAREAAQSLKGSEVQRITI